MFNPFWRAQQSLWQEIRRRTGKRVSGPRWPCFTMNCLLASSERAPAGGTNLRRIILTDCEREILESKASEGRFSEDRS